MLFRLILGLQVEARDHAVQGRIGADLRRVEEQLSPPEQPGLLAQIHNVLEEALEERQAQPLPDPGQAGMIGQRLIQPVAEIPAVREVEAGDVDQAPLRAEALEEQDQLEFEEHDGVDGRPAPSFVELLNPLADEAESELSIEVPVEIVSRDEAFERDRDGLVERTELRGTKHSRYTQGGAEEHRNPGHEPWRARAGGPDST